ncbi:hypothetical protein BV25DRAFT_1762834, partial [Artomyces pyxidatus]
MLEAIRSVFSRNSEYLGGSGTRIEKARRIMIQIVNALTVKLEIGGPMACLYILDHFDHYTSHTFKTFYWKPYVNEAKSAWEDVNEDETKHEKVVVNKVQDTLVALYAVTDYTLRPVEYKDMTLYDWTRRATKYKIPKERKKPQKQKDDDSIEQEDAAMDVDIDEDDVDFMLDSDDDNSSDSDYAGPSRKKARKKRKPKKVVRFLTDHAQHLTHSVRVCDDAKGKVPCFVGGLLPRRDQGNFEDYCMTMLTLFKPWRSGTDLKQPHQTWEDTFNEYDFTYRQRELMDFFQIRYECNDARDDFAAQRKADKKAMDKMNPIFGQFADDLDAQNMEDRAMANLTGLDAAAALEAQWDEIGPSAAKKYMQMLEIERVLQLAGWTDNEPGNGNTHLDEFIDGNELDDHAWKKVLANKKADALAQKQQQANATSSADDTDLLSSPKLRTYNVDAVKIVDHAYLFKKFKAKKKEDQTAIEATVDAFTLNDEQERAFKIIANHSVDESAQQLKMYIGGMAGTGKSQVIKALISFFEKRDQSFTFLILAP